LAYFIQKQLSSVQHTNIVICSPTFKINEYSSLFNQRVEIFNNLLHKHNLKNEYHYILDCNLNLSYDMEMFSWRGNVNKNGFMTIFNDLMTFLNSFPTDHHIIAESNFNLTQEAQHDSKGINKTLSTTFFRD
jgi:hypothetical protein